jgi:outer membrane protein assembly factor BamB
MPPLASRVLTIAALVFGLSSAATAQEWTRFRGPNGAGVGSAPTMPAEWGEDDVRWRVDLPGTGHGSPVLWGEKLFVTSADEDTGERVLYCLHADDGRELWSRQFESQTHRKHQLNSFASSTPAVDAERVYLFWVTPEDFQVHAVDHAGQAVWRRSLGEFKAGHGAGVSPVLFGELVIVANEHEGDSRLLALDRRTGEIRWQVARDSKVSYSTPCVYHPAGREPELIFTNWEHGITAIDPRTGRTKWAKTVFDPGHVETSIGSPIVVGELVLGTCGWLGHATHTVAVRPEKPSPGAPEASEPGTAREVYRVDRGAPLTTTPVAADGLLFLWADNGIVTCADARTGEVHWRERVGGTYYGSPVIAGGCVYCLSAQGEAVVLRASQKHELVARNELGDGSHSTPAIARGRMYLRTFSQLLCIGGK